ncbi:MAG: biopolymer transport protein ExbB [Verrucomicrobiales bacterium]|jgi:biopolymer transport protein ExbB
MSYKRIGNKLQLECSIAARRYFLIPLGWLLSLSPAVAQDEAEGGGANVVAPVADTTSLLEVYSQGGWMMHVLLLCSVGTIAVIVYCFLQITQKKMCPAGINDTLLRNMQTHDVSNAYALCEENPNAFTRVVSSALLKVNFERDRANKESMDQAAVDSLDQEEVRQMLWINYLNVFATVAPMVGLLGTVTGMMTSFNDLKGGAMEVKDFSGGIGEAMATTAGGLIVGIPAMFFYFFFRNKLMGIMTEVQKRATRLIDVLSGEVTLADITAAPSSDSKGA